MPENLTLYAMPSAGNIQPNDLMYISRNDSEDLAATGSSLGMNTLTTIASNVIATLIESTFIFTTPGNTLTLPANPTNYAPIQQNKPSLFFINSSSGNNSIISGSSLPVIVGYKLSGATAVPPVYPLSPSSIPTTTNVTVGSNVAVATANGGTLTTWIYNPAGDVSDISSNAKITPGSIFSIDPTSIAGNLMLTGSTVAGLVTPGSQLIVDTGAGISEVLVNTVSQTIPTTSTTINYTGATFTNTNIPTLVNMTLALNVATATAPAASATTASYTALGSVSQISAVMQITPYSYVISGSSTLGNLILTVPVANVPSIGNQLIVDQAGAVSQVTINAMTSTPVGTSVTFNVNGATTTPPLYAFNNTNVTVSNMTFTGNTAIATANAAAAHTINYLSSGNVDNITASVIFTPLPYVVSGTSTPSSLVITGTPGTISNGTQLLLDISGTTSAYTVVTSSSAPVAELVTYQITGAVNSGTTFALTATTLPTRSNMSIVGNVAIATAGSATAQTVDYIAAGTNVPTVIPTMQFTPTIFAVDVASTMSTLVIDAPAGQINLASNLLLDISGVASYAIATLSSSQITTTINYSITGATTAPPLYAFTAATVPTLANMTIVGNTGVATGNSASAQTVNYVVAGGNINAVTPTMQFTPISFIISGSSTTSSLVLTGATGAISLSNTLLLDIAGVTPYSILTLSSAPVTATIPYNITGAVTAAPTFALSTTTLPTLVNMSIAGNVATATNNNATAQTWNYPTTAGNASAITPAMVFTPTVMAVDVSSTSSVLVLNGQPGLLAVFDSLLLDIGGVSDYTIATLTTSSATTPVVYSISGAVSVGNNYAFNSTTMPNLINMAIVGNTAVANANVASAGSFNYIAATSNISTFTPTMQFTPGNQYTVSGSSTVGNLVVTANNAIPINVGSVLLIDELNTGTVTPVTVAAVSASNGLIPSQGLSATAYANGLYFAYSTQLQKLLVSFNNGLSWTVTVGWPPPPAGMTGIIYDAVAGMYLTAATVGAYVSVYGSTDGINWANQVNLISSTNAYTLTTTSNGSSILITIGFLVNVPAVSWHSPVGTHNWQQNTNPFLLFPTGSNVNIVAASSGGFYWIAGPGTVGYYSSDSVNWFAFTLPGDRTGLYTNVSSMYFDGSKLYLSGTDNATAGTYSLYRSTTSVNAWSSLFNAGNALYVAGTPGLYVATQYYSTNFYTSSNGTSWSAAQTATGIGQFGKTLITDAAHFLIFANTPWGTTYALWNTSTYLFNVSTTNLSTATYTITSPSLPAAVPAWVTLGGQGFEYSVSPNTTTTFIAATSPTYSRATNLVTATYAAVSGTFGNNVQFQGVNFNVADTLSLIGASILEPTGLTAYTITTLPAMSSVPVWAGIGGQSLSYSVSTTTTPSFVASTSPTFTRAANVVTVTYAQATGLTGTNVQLKALGFNFNDQLSAISASLLELNGQSQYTITTSPAMTAVPSWAALGGQVLLYSVSTSVLPSFTAATLPLYVRSVNSITATYAPAAGLVGNNLQFLAGNFNNGDILSQVGGTLVEYLGELKYLITTTPAMSAIPTWAALGGQNLSYSVATTSTPSFSAATSPSFTRSINLVSATYAAASGLTGTHVQFEALNFNNADVLSQIGGVLTESGAASQYTVTTTPAMTAVPSAAFLGGQILSSSVSTTTTPSFTIDTLSYTNVAGTLVATGATRTGQTGTYTQVKFANINNTEIVSGLSAVLATETGLATVTITATTPSLTVALPAWVGLGGQTLLSSVATIPAFTTHTLTYSRSANIITYTGNAHTGLSGTNVLVQAATMNSGDVLSQIGATFLSGNGTYTYTVTSTTPPVAVNVPTWVALGGQVLSSSVTPTSTPAFVVDSLFYARSGNVLTLSGATRSASGLNVILNISSLNVGDIVSEIGADLSIITPGFSVILPAGKSCAIMPASDNNYYSFFFA